MEQKFYLTDQFEVPQFQQRKVIEEIKMTMTAFDCMLPDDAGIYCSSEITTGKRFYELLEKHGVKSKDNLKAKLGDEEFKRVDREFVKENVKRGVAFAEKLRERGLINVVTPGPYYASDFGQEHYLYLWESFIRKKAYEVCFANEWEYSNGCTFEYAVALNKGIPRLDYQGNHISQADAIEKVTNAVAELKAKGFMVEKLEKYLGYLKPAEQ
jgi:hypothetical protein